MVKKKVVFVILVLFGLFCEMVGKCFADASAELEQGKTYKDNRDYEQAEAAYQGVLTNYGGTDYALQAQERLGRLYISWEKYADAQTTVDSIISDFNNHPNLPSTLYSLARRYRGVRKHEEAKDVYREIIDRCPDSEYAEMAQANLTGIDVLSHIESGNDAAAQAGIDKLVQEPSGNPGVPEALYHIAGKYERSKEYERAKSICQVIMQQFPDSVYAGRARLAVARINVESLIMSGDYTGAEAAFDELDKLVAGSSDEYPGLPRTAYYVIARRYRGAGKKFEDAKEIFQEMIEQYPDDWQIGKAQLDVVKTDIYRLINSGQHSEAQAAIDNMIVDFSSHYGLPRAVFRSGQKYYKQALRYQKQALSVEAKDFFRKTISIWDRIITKLPQSPTTIWAYYFSADCYCHIGEYENAIEYYRIVVDNWPDYEYAWNAQFLIGRSYEQLRDSGDIAESVANAEIKAAYEQLLEKYPGCKAARIARRWLQEK